MHIKLAKGVGYPWGRGRLAEAATQHQANAAEGGTAKKPTLTTGPKPG